MIIIPFHIQWYHELSWMPNDECVVVNVILYFFFFRKNTPCNYLLNNNKNVTINTSFSVFNGFNYVVCHKTPGTLTGNMAKSTLLITPRYSYLIWLVNKNEKKKCWSSGASTSYSTLQSKRNVLITILQRLWGRISSVLGSLS